MFSWEAVGNPKTLRLLARRFRFVEKLYIAGTYSPEILCGIRSNEVRRLSKLLPPVSISKDGTTRMSITSNPTPVPLPLTHLYLDGAHSESFSAASLLTLLQSVKGTLQSLAIGRMRGPLSLNEIGEMIPNLKTLCVTFSLQLSTSFSASSSNPSSSSGCSTPLTLDSDSDSEPPTLRPRPNFQTLIPLASSNTHSWSPALYGDLSPFKSLKQLTLTSSFTTPQPQTSQHLFRVPVNVPRLLNSLCSPSRLEALYTERVSFHPDEESLGLLTGLKMVVVDFGAEEVGMRYMDVMQTALPGFRWWMVGSRVEGVFKVIGK
ncbi:hypothetical protein HDV05_000458, partial [Chytridiales sp. JEL 0842]